MSDELVERIREKLRQTKQAMKPARSEQVSEPDADRPLEPSFEPSPDSIVGRAYAANPEYARRSRHNYAVHEAWSKIACPGCGGSLTAGWGVLPDPMREPPLDLRKPPALCYGCDVASKRGEEPPVAAFGIIGHRKPVADPDEDIEDSSDFVDDLGGVVYEYDIG